MRSTASPPASEAQPLPSDEASPPISMKSKIGVNFLVSVGRTPDTGDNALAKLLQASQEMVSPLLCCSCTFCPFPGLSNIGYLWVSGSVSRYLCRSLACHKPRYIFHPQLGLPSLLNWSLLPVCQAKRPYRPAAYIQMNLNP